MFASVVTLTLICTSCNSIKNTVTIVPNASKNKVDVLFDGKLFTSYIYPADMEKPVLYPLHSAGGTVITRGFPLVPRPNERVDHPHHVGSWLNFMDVNGVDFWNNSYAIPADKKPKYGSIRHREVISTKNGSKGILIVAADWIDHNGKVLLKEETQFIFGGGADIRTIERTTKLTAQAETVTFTDNKDGLIAIRMDRAFEEPSDKADNFLDANGISTEVKAMNNEGVNGVYRNSEGLEKGDVWGKPTQWVSLSAEKAGEKITVAIIDHKNNPGYPAHSHARGYGLFSTNNFGSQVFDENAPLFKLVLNSGESTVLKHKIIIKSGSFATDAEINRITKEFNKP
ncbi:MAG: PmoA family protein [Tannerella sp.]|nr:PmoA family protein [Tannerella sp.]